MTPEQGSKSEENCNLRPAKAGHSGNICLTHEHMWFEHKARISMSGKAAFRDDMHAPNPALTLKLLTGACCLSALPSTPMGQSATKADREAANMLRPPCSATGWTKRLLYCNAASGHRCMPLDTFKTGQQPAEYQHCEGRPLRVGSHWTALAQRSSKPSHAGSFLHLVPLHHGSSCTASSWLMIFNDLASSLQ